MGASRHAADIRADAPSKESQTILHSQSGMLQSSLRSSLSFRYSLLSGHDLGVFVA